MREFSWSESEKKAAGKAFDAAWSRESAALVENVKRLAASAAGVDDIWSLTKPTLQFSWPQWAPTLKSKCGSVTYKELLYVQS